MATDVGSPAIERHSAAVDLTGLLGWADDAAAGEHLSFRIQVQEQSHTLSPRRVMRVLPGRRLVMSGELWERPVVIKWFLGATPNAPRRYAARERRGVEALARAQIQTAGLLAHWVGTDSTSGLCFEALVFAEIEHSQALSDALLQREPELWPSMWELLARLTRAGITHTDLHFDNILHVDNQLWLIDGDGVRAADPQQPLNEAATLRAFAGLAAQTRSVQSAGELQEHWQSYSLALGVDGIAPGITAVERAYRSARRQRVLQYQAKTRRSCSDFLLRKAISGQALLDRRWLVAVDDKTNGGSVNEATRAHTMLRWLDQLPAEFRKLEAEPESTRWLKRGNTATVARLGFGAMELVVKRYNNKSLWHRLRRALRRDRGLNSWVYSHTLRFAGLPTARCVALLRTRWIGPTYLVMEAIPGVELTAEHLEGDEPLCRQLVQLLDALGAEGFVHNDTKASNFLLTDRPAATPRPEHDTPAQPLVLIDLDAMQFPASAGAQRSGHERDRRRLLRNFASSPELQRRFRSLLEL